MSIWCKRHQATFPLAREDITELATEVDDDETYTRAPVIGNANLGAKYLAEQFPWPGPGSPAGIEYEKTTKTVWTSTTTATSIGWTRRRNMAVLEPVTIPRVREPSSRRLPCGAQRRRRRIDPEYKRVGEAPASPTERNS